MEKTIFFLLPYPLKRAHSQRFRVEAFFDLLNDEKIHFRPDSFLTDKAWNVLYQKGSFLQKTIAVLSGYTRRLFVIFFIAIRYKYIFIHREAAPLGPPVFE